MSYGLLPAIVLNLSAGLLYTWSLFLLPLERMLGATRGSLSLVPSLAWATFTLGMVLCPWLLARAGWRGYLLATYALMSLGFVIFGHMPSYGTLLIGYGGAFGLAAGLAYGLALVVATDAHDRNRALSMGLTMSSFTLCGILVPPLFGHLIATVPTQLVFSSIGLVYIAVGAILLAFARPVRKRPKNRNDKPGSKDKFLDSDFVKLFLVFFFLCFVGIMSLSQLGGITSSLGFSESNASLAISCFTIGSLLGSLGGAWVVENIGGRNTILAAGVAMIAGIVIVTFADTTGLLYFGAATIGSAFGSSASFMPMLISVRFGADRVSDVYGRMMIAYGAAGFIAPWLTGSLYTRSLSYSSGLVLAASMAVLAVIAGLTLSSNSASEPRKRRHP